MACHEFGWLGRDGIAHTRLRIRFRATREVVPLAKCANWHVPSAGFTLGGERRAAPFNFRWAFVCSGAAAGEFVPKGLAWRALASLYALERAHWVLVHTGLDTIASAHSPNFSSRAVCRSISGRLGYSIRPAKSNAWKPAFNELLVGILTQPAFPLRGCLRIFVLNSSGDVGTVVALRERIADVHALSCLRCLGKQPKQGGEQNWRICTLLRYLRSVGEAWCLRPQDKETCRAGRLFLPPGPQSSRRRRGKAPERRGRPSTWCLLSGFKRSR
jgi:hypothetical protein